MNADITQRIDFLEYEKFLKKNYESTFYQSLKHLEFLREVLNSEPFFITVRENNNLTGVLPFFEKNSSLGKVINSLPFFGSYGGFVSDKFSVRKKILETLNNYNIENDILSSVIIENPFTNYHEIYEEYYKFNLKESRRIQCIDLEEKNEEIIWNSFEQRVRRAVRKAQKNNVKVQKLIPNEEGVSNFFQMHKKEMEAKNGRVKPPEFFKHLKNSFTPNENYDIFCASINDKDIAYLLVFYFNLYTEYYMPAYDSDFKSTQVTSALLWESIKTSLDKKIKYYNFGGTWKNQPELYLYKRGWAAEECDYNYYIFGNLERAQKAGLKEIKKNYPYFYVFSYEQIQNSES